MYSTFQSLMPAFYLWAQTPIDDAEFARGLFEQQNVTLLPGQFVSRASTNGNPGQNRVRMALVASTEECVEAALRIKQYMPEPSALRDWLC